MAEYALTSAPMHGVNTDYKKACLLQVVLTFVAGVPTVNVARSAKGFTIAGDTGVYTGTAPKAARGLFQIQTLTATASSFGKVTSYVPTTGVFAFEIKTTSTGAALDVATGDEVWLLFLLEGG